MVVWCYRCVCRFWRWWRRRWACGWWRRWRRSWRWSRSWVLCVVKLWEIWHMQSVKCLEAIVIVLPCCFLSWRGAAGIPNAPRSAKKFPRTKQRQASSLASPPASPPPLPTNQPFHDPENADSDESLDYCHYNATIFTTTSPLSPPLLV